LLIAAGADINAKAAGPDGNERTAFMCALEKKCCTRALDVVLHAGADLCARSTGCCMTALHMAAVTGSTECCELLLERTDMLLELRDVNDWTALTHAAHRGHLDIVQLLLQHGADMNVVSRDLTPLIAASSQKRGQVVVCLLKSGADVNAVGSNGHFALAAAVQSTSVAIVQLLLDNGADIGERDSLGHNALFRAAHQGLVFMMELLVHRGLSVAAVDNEGHSVLMMAAVRGHTQAVEWLLQQGTAVDAVDNRGLSSLHNVSASTSCDNAAMAELLIANGADVHKCIEGGVTPLSAAARLGNVECAKVLIAAGADVNHFDSDGLAALHMAIIKQCGTAVKLLLDNGATAVMNSVTPARCVDECCAGLTALMMCTEPDVVELLLAAGADVNVKNDAGDTCLHVAARHKSSARALGLLIKAGADLHAVNSDGKTAAQLAHGNEHTLIEQLLTRAAR
jgi:ankyrin repeat protein